MNATDAAPSLPWHASRVVRARRRGRRCFPKWMHQRALGWVLWWRRKRLRWSAEKVAERAGVGVQTVRDLERGLKGDFFWGTAWDVCLALGVTLPDQERLAHRLLCAEYAHQAHENAEDPSWKMTRPWSKKRATPRIRSVPFHARAW